MDWVDRFVKVRQWSRGDERAPHKPLLLLYALGQFQRDGGLPIVYSSAEEKLSQLLQEFGPPRKTNPAYPFHHLTSDGLWRVRTPHGEPSPGHSVIALRNGATGQLAPDLLEALRAQPDLLAGLARALLDANFEPSLHEDLCDAVGLSLKMAETGQAVESQGRQRDPAFREQILLAYEYRCAFCDYDGWIRGRPVGLDAAHVRWWAYDGPDEIANGLCLCAMHHKLFDKGVLGIATQRTILVSAAFVGRSAAARTLVLSLAEREVIEPQSGFATVENEHLDWHRREVFRAPARTV